jgi:hypothetical protein
MWSISDMFLSLPVDNQIITWQHTNDDFDVYIVCYVANLCHIEAWSDNAGNWMIKSLIIRSLIRLFTISFWYIQENINRNISDIDHISPHNCWWQHLFFLFLQTCFVCLWCFIRQGTLFFTCNWNEVHVYYKCFTTL